MNGTSAEIRVAVVEDREEEREGLVELLNSRRGFKCVADCASAREALETLPACEPDIVLMDIQMPGMSGIDCVRELQPSLPEAQFMMLTVVEDHDRIFRSLAAGATGYMQLHVHNRTEAVLKGIAGTETW